MIHAKLHIPVIHLANPLPGTQISTNSRLCLFQEIEKVNASAFKSFREAVVHKEYKNALPVLSFPQNFLLLRKQPASPSKTLDRDVLEVGFGAGFSQI